MAADGEQAAAIGVRMPPTLGPGWAELVVTGLADAASSQPLEPRVELLVGMSGQPEMSYELTLTPDGALLQVLHLDQAVGWARIAAQRRPGPRVIATLRPLPWPALVQRALRIDRAEALSALRWRLVGKKVRSRNILLRLFGQPRSMAYASWLARQKAGWDAEVTALIARIDALAKASMDVLVVCHGHKNISHATEVSIGRQVLAARETRCIDAMASAGRQAPLRDVLAACHSDWIVVLPDGQALAPDALLRLADVVATEPRAVAFTWDSDTSNADGAPHAPEFKPTWNEALFLARDYVGAFAVSRGALETGLASTPQLPAVLPDALLLATARARLGPVPHVPRILSHRTARSTADDARDVLADRCTLVEAHIRGEQSAATACLTDGGMIRVRFPLPEPRPLVSLIVPTRDRLDLLQPCLEGLLRHTAYGPIEVLIADNGSSAPATLRFLAAVTDDPRVRVVDCAGPFNFAAINNRAVAEARGPVLGFINNDVEPRAPDWLDVMTAHALRPGIGAVGARLVYPSGLVQHAGVVLGVGGHAGHAHRFAKPTDWGYLGRLQAEQYVAAVTAACLVVEKAKFEAVGGFDALAFPVAYNDVDLCLRLRAAGFETLWTPYAELLHKESASRVKDYSPARRAAYEEECRRLTERWGRLIADDPYYHPALSRRLENFSLE